MEGGEHEAVLKGWLEEKRYDPSYPLPILDPEPVQQASIRRSIVSWFRRSSKHHPLRLNPFHRKSSGGSATSIITDAPMSRSGSIATTLRTNRDGDTQSRERVVEEGSGSGKIGFLEEIAPMTDLGLYGSNTNTTEPTPASSEPATIIPPPPAFTREDARAYYKSMWAESSAAGSSERMSAMSSWTESTARTSTQGGVGRESMEQAGLSPPPGFAHATNWQRFTQTPASSVAMTITTGTSGRMGSPGIQPKEREELYAVHEQT